MSLEIRLPREKFNVTWDALSIFSVVVSLLCFLWISTWIDYAPDLASKSMLALNLLFAGLVLGSFFVKHSIDYGIDKREFMKVVLYFIACVVAIMLGGAVIPHEAIEIRAWQFAVLIAAAEEVFFRYGVTSMLVNFTGEIPAVIMSALLFSVYHLAVYGETVDLALIFVGGLVLAYAFIKTRRLTPCILAHMLVNFLATYPYSIT